MTDMRLWIMADIHVEQTRGWDLRSGHARPSFDVLVIAGDLIPRMERGVRWLRERIPDRTVIYVAGNHEFYGVDVDRTVEKAKEAAAGTNVHVLQNDTICIDNVTFAGATTWTDFNLFGDQRRAMAVAADRMNDFRKIRTAKIRGTLPADARARSPSGIPRILRGRDAQGAGRAAGPGLASCSASRTPAAPVRPANGRRDFDGGLPERSDGADVPGPGRRSWYATAR